MWLLKSIGKDGKSYYFKYELENQYDTTRGTMKICFKTTFVTQNDDNWFDFKLAPVNDNTMQVSDMFDTIDSITLKPLFKGKGLPEALILEAQKVYPDKIIISATGDGRWGPGTAVWERLVRSGHAWYDKENDIYILIK